MHMMGDWFLHYVHLYDKRPRSAHTITSLYCNSDFKLFAVANSNVLAQVGNSSVHFVL